MPDWLALAVLSFGSWGTICALLALWAEAAPVGDEHYFVTTDDGWTLSLHRFLPKNGAAPRPYPLVLAHGLNMNRASWALGSGASLIEALTARGHDVFTLEYRGTSGSRPGASKRWSYTIDDHLDRDIPALLREIERLTGSPQVHWVGHSMGGMLLYLYAGRHGGEQIRRAVTLASPISFRLPRRVPRALGSMVTRVLYTPLRVPLLLGSFFSLPFSIALRGLTMRRFLNPAHLSLREVAALCSSALEDVSGPIYGLFVDLATSRKDLCPPQDSDVEGLKPSGLAALEAPLLIVASESDRIAPPGAVELAFERAGSEQAAYVCLGSPSEGANSPSFGHCDLASGTAATTWVLPLLADWFESDLPTAPSALRSRGLDSMSPPEAATPALHPSYEPTAP